jgi:drug/metabolite transporter (DMT)-like permease
MEDILTTLKDPATAATLAGVLVALFVQLYKKITGHLPGNWSRARAAAVVGALIAGFAAEWLLHGGASGIDWAKVIAGAIGSYGIASTVWAQGLKQLTAKEGDGA